MLRFFRINDPYRLLGVLFGLILFSLPFFIDPVPISIQELRSVVLGEAIHGKLMYADVYDQTPPLAAAIHGLLDSFFGRSLFARHTLAVLFLFFQAAFFGILLINNKAYAESSYVPSFIFAVLSVFSVDMVAFSPELLASTLLLLALNNLFKEIEFTRQHDQFILNLGVYIGMATLIVFSTYIFFIGTVVILILSTRVNPRRLLLLLFGFLLPHALLIIFYYYRGETGILWTNFYKPNLLPTGQYFIGLGGIFVLFALPLLYFIFSLITIGRDARLTKYQSQLVQVMFLWLLVAVIYFFLSSERTPHSLIFIFPPLAFLISHYFVHIRRKFLAELLLWVFVSGVITLSLMARYNKLDSVNYASLFPTVQKTSPIRAQRILVLNEPEGYYLENQPATGFLNWTLSREIFEKPEYFEHSILILKLFRKDMPQVIVDKNDLMKGVFKRIPELRSRYKREGIYYKLISSS
ncbi:MAG TPA: hypothetical protein VFE57_02830 [Cyclobacteriaceae bacterium]|nr:hypothetical protein [Cyclobacteriaceae bacterium]